ncbi:hypothetical protein B4U80_08893 [Leptotrombidium deliense]|uniref:Uncharacterized protein n=1 Tax=Leptotrombidium deliense TaxID=299467 RepID=A0A443SJX7_9ACAR|nr:hypothetical protein B4U80_08893 [Leptotrombidium deliense]
MDIRQLFAHPHTP